VHLIQLGQILRDADVANGISAIVQEYRLTEKQTEQALNELRVPRSANIAGITHRVFPPHPLLCNYQGKLWSEVARFSS